MDKNTHYAKHQLSTKEWRPSLEKSAYINQNHIETSWNTADSGARLPCPIYNLLLILTLNEKSTSTKQVELKPYMRT